MSQWWRLSRPAGVTRRDLALFTRSLARLMEAGLPLAEAVRLAADVPGGPLAELSGDLCAEIRAGAGLSAALARHDPPTKPVFGPVYRALTGAAEAGGTLAQSLNRLADYTERAEQLVQSVRSGLIYPALLLGAALVSLLILLLFVVPRFESLFAGLGQDVPFLTRMIIGGAGLLRNYGWLLLVSGAAGIFYLRRRMRDTHFRRTLQARFLTLPLFGPVLTKIILERMARSLAELLTNGVGLPEALTLSASVGGDNPYQKGLMRTAERVREGRPLSDALADQGLFPELMLQLVRVGEHGSALAPMLGHLADIYAMDVEANAKRLIALLEPLMVLLIGGVMGIVIIAMIGAISSVNDLVIR
ncbi:MAG: hypothetical protein EXR08_03890 [Alphaproteobacteria bacterium]|nr:hypothetical protein [Alphaproteobacteria bacterium]